MVMYLRYFCFTQLMIFIISDSLFTISCIYIICKSSCPEQSYLQLYVFTYFQKLKYVLFVNTFSNHGFQYCQIKPFLK